MPACLVRDASVDCPQECGYELLLALDICLRDPDAIADETAFMTCLESKFSDNCHDCLCDALADEGSPCPGSLKKKGVTVEGSLNYLIDLFFSCC